LDLAEDRGRFLNFDGIRNSFPQFAETADEASALADVLTSIIDSSFLCVGWSRNENCNQQARTGRT
jgi:hypothetical protein